MIETEKEMAESIRTMSYIQYRNKLIYGRNDAGSGVFSTLEWLGVLLLSTRTTVCLSILMFLSDPFLYMLNNNGINSMNITIHIPTNRAIEPIELDDKRVFDFVSSICTLSALKISKPSEFRAETTASSELEESASFHSIRSTSVDSVKVLSSAVVSCVVSGVGLNVGLDVGLVVGYGEGL